MSLFSLITWWSGQVSDSAHDPVADGRTTSALVLCVNRFNSFESSSDHVEKDTIFVGSSSGMLSIYQPSDVFYVTGHQSPTDVILECQLNEPIIDIKCGKFAMTKSEKYSIAVLHPTRVSCYNIAFAEGIAAYGKQFKLNLAFECNLSSPAFSLCNGPFGGIKSKEFFCISHLAKPHLHFYEQDGISSEGVLPGERTLPSKMLYLARIDCFAVVTMPEDVLECYKYQDLTSQNTAAPVWTFCVGEFVLQMDTHQTTNSESVILILGEHSLICLTDSGLIKFIKKLDYVALTFHSFVIGYYFEPDARLMIAIASDMESLFVYEAGNSVAAAGPVNCKLIWSTQLPFVPVALSRANYEGMPGGLVLLSQTGKIHVAFFGTDPQIFKVAPLMDSDDNVHNESIQRELNSLEGDIKNGIDFTGKIFPYVSFINAATSRDLITTITIKPELMACTPEMMKALDDKSGNPKMVAIQLKLTPKVPFEQIQIAINPPPPLLATENSIMFERVDAEQSLEWECWIYPTKPQAPQSLSVPVIVSMINRQGIPRILQKSAYLPAQLLFKSCPPQKEAQHKLIISVKSATKEILDLFPEFATDTINQQALGLECQHTGDVVTIVLGKNSNRYRIQSDSLAIIPIAIELLLRRHHQKLMTTTTTSNQSGLSSSITAATDTPEGISISQGFNVDQLMDNIQVHADCRSNVKRWDKEIEQKSRQMRLFQRKLFLKLQQDPPHPSYNSAAKLLRLTHAELTTDLQEHLLASVDRLRQSQSLLGNHLRLIKLTIHHSKMPQQVKDNLFAALVCPINDWIEMSWEETLAPAIELLSHVGPLGKQGSSSSGDMEDIKSFAQLPFDMARFKKNLKYILEKIEREAESEFENFKMSAMVMPKEETSEWVVEKEDNDVPAAANGEDDPLVNDMDLV